MALQQSNYIRKQVGNSGNTMPSSKVATNRSVTRMSGGSAIVAALLENGVNTLFGLPGGQTCKGRSAVSASSARRSSLGWTSRRRTLGRLHADGRGATGEGSLYRQPRQPSSMSPCRSSSSTRSAGAGDIEKDSTLILTIVCS